MSWLPTKVTPPAFDPSALKILLFGRPKIGKSTWAASFPDALFICSEEGHRHLELRRVSVDAWTQEKTWKDNEGVTHCGFLELLAELQAQKAAGDLPFKSFVVDTADQLFKMCFDYYCDREGIKHPQDQPYGKGWDGLSNTFRRAIIPLTRLGCGIVFISHTKTNTVTVGKDEVEKHDVTLSNQAKGVILPLVDVMLRADYATNMETGDTHRVLVAAGSAHMTAGSRWSLPEHFPMTIREGYKKLLGHLKDPTAISDDSKKLKISNFKIKK